MGFQFGFGWHAVVVGVAILRFRGLWVVVVGIEIGWISYGVFFLGFAIAEVGGCGW